MPYYPESKLLRPLDADARADSDSWPEFVLRGVRIISQHTKKITTLLKAHRGNKVTVIGRLDRVDKEHAHLLLASAQNQPTIVIKDVYVYSFSQFDDGSFGFWAAGQAGWFELRSAASTSDFILLGMQEAASMFYFLADKFASDGKVQKPGQYVKSLWQEYAKTDSSRRQDATDAREGFHEHRDFLIRSMLEGQEGLDWEDSVILRHFKRVFSEDYKSWTKIVHEQQDSSAPEPAPTDVDSETSQSEEIEEPKPRRANAKRRKAAETEDLISDQEVVAESHARIRGGLRLRGQQPVKKYTGAISAKETPDNEMSEDDEEMTEAREPTISVPDFSKIMGAKRTADDRLAGAMANSAPVPSYYEIRGPGDTWTCSYDGCNHQIWDARTAQSQNLIEDHFTRKHAENMEDLIVSESSGRVSVQHLLSRVKKFRSMDAAAMAQVINGELPDRVLRRY